MITIGNRVVLSTQTLLIKNDQVSSIDVEGPGFKLKAKITFENPGGEAEVKFTSSTGDIEIRFLNWNQGLGHCTPQEGLFMHTAAGGKVSFMAWGQAIGDIIKLDIQFLFQKGFGQ
jgi:hypothetical protein